MIDGDSYIFEFYQNNLENLTKPIKNKYINTSFLIIQYFFNKKKVTLIDSFYMMGSAKVRSLLNELQNLFYSNKIIKNEYLSNIYMYLKMIFINLFFKYNFIF